MFGIGWTEFILIAVVLLIIVGPKHMPAMFRKLGRITAEFRSASRELRNQIEIEADDLQSPREMARDLERDVLRKVNEPYAELAEQDRQIRRDLEQAVADEPAADEPTADVPGEPGVKDRE